MIKTYNNLPFDKEEILRYLGVYKADESVNELLSECTAEIKDKLTYKVCYEELYVSVKDSTLNFGVFKVYSKDLSRVIEKSEKAVVFCATLGIEPDRLINKYSHISPSKALMFQAIGASQIEALCDKFSEDIRKEKNKNITRRFSPGYGDLSIYTQKDISAFLNLPKNIGVALNKSMLMSPSKSVTAFFGLTDEKTCDIKNKCSECEKTDCAFKR